MNFKTSFDTTYHALLQPLHEFDKCLNTVKGMLSYIALVKKTSSRFDDTFAAAIERAQLQYPGREEEMNAYVLELKQAFVARYMPVKETVVQL